jgi:hypothetical protein
MKIIKKVSRGFLLNEILLLIITILLIIVGYEMYKSYKSSSTIESFNEEMIKEEYPELLVETGYEPRLYTDNPLPNDLFDKYSIKQTKRDLKEFTDVLYLGNPL